MQSQVLFTTAEDDQAVQVKKKTKTSEQNRKMVKTK